MQGSKGDPDVKNRLWVSVGEGESGMIRENSVETYLIICETDEQCKFDT